VGTTKSLTNFTSAVFQSEVYLPDFVAKDKGFYAAHGINMNFVTPASGAAAAQLMLAGQVQGWSTDPQIALTAAAKGEDIRLAGLEVPTQIYWLLVAKNGNWPSNSASFNQKMAALEGKTVGVSGIGAGTDHALLAGLNAAGLPLNSVNRVGIGQQTAAIGQLQAGSISAFVSFSLAGNAIIAQQTGARVLVAFGGNDVPSSVRNIPGLGMAVQGSFAQQHPKVIADWRAADQEAIDWIKKNPAQAAVVLNKYVYNGVQLALAKQVIPEFLSGVFSSIPPGLKMSRTSFDLGIKALKEIGAIPSTAALTYENAVIPSARASS
jgi:ABC-type nitrate/sulfonate/bicarbonate transport system substrate-binding protein